MIQSNNRTFLQILRSDTFDVDNFIRNEFNAIVSILEEYGVDSACELQKKLHPPKTSKKPQPNGFDSEAFLNDCRVCLRRREAGENVDEQISALVEKFDQNKTSKKLTIQKFVDFASEFGLSLNKKEKADLLKSKFRTWLQTGQKPLTEEQKCLQEYKGRWHKIYNVSNKTTDGRLPQEDIEQLVALVQEIPDKVVKTETLKSFLSDVGIENITGKGRDAIVNNLRKRLEGNDSASKKGSSRTKNSTPQATPEEKLESYRQQVRILLEKLASNPTDEIKKDTVRQIKSVVQDAYDGSNKLNKDPFISFIQDTFGNNIKGQTKQQVFDLAIEHVEKCFLTSPVIQHEEKQEAKTELSEQTDPNVKQCVSSSPTIQREEKQDTKAELLEQTAQNVKQCVSSPQTFRLEEKQECEKSDSLEGYISEARRLRAEELRADDTISKIVDLAKTVKNKYQVEGLRKFMNGLGISYFGNNTGGLIDIIKKQLKEEAFMRAKFNRIQEMK